MDGSRDGENGESTSPDVVIDGAHRSSPRAAAIAVARWAREQVPLYRELYADAGRIESWAAFRRLPVLTAARLRATPLAEQVDTLDDVVRSQTAYALESAVTTRALVLDSDDTDAAFEQTRAAFALAGVRRGTRVLFVAPPHQRYVAAELADQLGYYRVEAHLVIAADAAACERALTAIQPERVVSFGVPPPRDDARWISVRQPSGGCADFYLIPEAGIVAVRAPATAWYRVLSRFCLLEQSAGRLLLTALLRYHQPLIRYELPDRGAIARRRLCLESVAL